MKILVTGIYDPEYNRNKVLVSGLRKLGVDVVEFPFKSKFKVSWKKLRELADDVDFIYMPPFTHLEVWFVKKIVKNKPIVFDPLISKYMTKVFDYKKVSKYSIRGVKNYMKDKIPVSNADVVICDTHLHEKYFHEEFGVNYSKMGVVHVGYIPEDFTPENNQIKNDDTFRVGFYGTFNPLQGIDKIVGAAKILKDQRDIRFDIIGKGPLYSEINRLAKKENNLKNIHFHGLKPYNELGEMLNSFDICLGIFGESIKTDIVIPNKIYHYAAVGKAIITKDTEGIREGFEHEKNIWLVGNTSKAIAESILKLKNNDSLRNRIGEQARETAEQKYTDVAVAKEFLNVLTEKKLILNNN